MAPAVRAAGRSSLLPGACLALQLLHSISQQATEVEEAASVGPRYVLHIVADDLGYNDVNWRNHQSITPTLDALNAEGVEIPEFYVRLVKLTPTDAPWLCHDRTPKHSQ